MVGKEYPEQLDECQLVKKDDASWSRLQII
jgi:hypothetical protein